MGKKYKANVRVYYYITFEVRDEETEGMPSNEDLRLMAIEAFDELYPVCVDKDHLTYDGAEIAGGIVEVGPRLT